MDSKAECRSDSLTAAAAANSSDSGPSSLTGFFNEVGTKRRTANSPTPRAPFTIGAGDVPRRSGGKRTRLTVDVPPETFARVEDWAARENVTFARMTRAVLLAGLFWYDVMEKANAEETT